MLKKIKYLIKEVFGKIVKDESQSLAAEMAFNILLSIFPFCLFIISIIGYFGTDQSIDQVMNILAPLLPSEVLNVIQIVLKEIISSTSGSTLTFGLLIALWGASNAIRIIMKALNKAYEVEETRPFIGKTFLSMVIVVLMSFVMIFATNFFFIWSFAVKLFVKYIPTEVINITMLVRWPISFGTLFFIFYIIYYFTPNIKSSRYIKVLSCIPGTLFFCVFWIIASWFFTLYIENIAHYNAIYGTLGTFIILLIWIYYTSLIILIGGEINSEVFSYLNRKNFMNLLR